MAQNGLKSPLKWKKPDEVMQMHRLKRKKKALQERMSQPSQSCPDLSTHFGKSNDSPNFSRILGSSKRKNPFSKNALESNNKEFCADPELNGTLDESSDSTLFQLLGMANKNNEPEKPPVDHTLTTFTNILNTLTKTHAAVDPEIKSSDGKRYLPVDWTLRTKMRLMSPKPFAWNQKLKASEEASGITGYVRCLDTSNSSTLDTSHHARFHQHCLYWQHPSLPWLSLFPRTTGRVSKKNFIGGNEDIKDALHKEWSESFRSLYQLVRARQCPFFYVCANTFTCLFRAAGIGGIDETCAFLSPTTRGLRQTLKQEEIEFTMPLKKNTTKRKSGDVTPKSNSTTEDKDDGNEPKNSSYDSCYDTMDNNTNNAVTNGLTDDLHSEVVNPNKDEASGDEDEMESDEWLQSLGVAADEIKKINNSQMRLNQVAESTIDSGAESLICIQGVDAQALFNFLLNCKSCISLTGTFGGIPPTLLSPTAFQGGTLQPLKVRESLLHSDGGKYYSMELRGPILPTTVHSLCSLLESNSNSFSATFANLQHTVPFSKAVQIDSGNDKSKENVKNNIPNVFGRENLSDCGLNPSLLKTFCSSEPVAVECIDGFKFCHEKKEYLWS